MLKIKYIFIMVLIIHLLGKKNFTVHRDDQQIYDVRRKLIYITLT